MKFFQLWEDVLKNGFVGIYDNFFDCGGYFLKVMVFVLWIVKEFDVQVLLKDVFVYLMVEGLVIVICEGMDSLYEVIKFVEKQEIYLVFFV